MTSRVQFGGKTYGMMGYMEKVVAGHYQLQWTGSTVDVVKVKQGPFKWIVKVDGTVRFYAVSLNEAMVWVDSVWGIEMVMTYNMLGDRTHNFPIERKHKGGCCDPATERYHSM